MALEQVQTVSKGSAAAVVSQEVTLTSTPTKGNLLTCDVGSDATVTMNSTGWTLGKSQVNAIGLYQWGKIAGEAESKVVKCSPRSATPSSSRSPSGNPAPAARSNPTRRPAPTAQGPPVPPGRGLPGRSAGPLRWRDSRSASTR
jgi:hypothetical protein